MPKAKGRGEIVSGVKGFQQQSSDRTAADEPQTLADLGISKNQSSEWQSRHLIGAFSDAAYRLECMELWRSKKRPLRGASSKQVYA